MKAIFHDVNKTEGNSSPGKDDRCSTHMAAGPT